VRLGGILLAAGRSRRFGADKRLAELPGGETVLARSLSLLSGAVDDALLVVGATDPEDAFRVRFPGVRVIRARRSAEGMGGSLAEAIGAEDRWDACLVALADKPFLRPATLVAVRAALASHPLVVPCCDGEWGHPVGFLRSLFPELRRCTGDSGARSVVLAHRDDALLLETGDPGVLADIDTPQDLAGLAARFDGSGQPPAG